MPEIVEMVRRTRERRVTDINEVGDDWHYCYVTDDETIAFNRPILRWIDEFTTGRFYIDADDIIFEKSEDAFIFEMGFGNPKSML